MSGLLWCHGKLCDFLVTGERQGWCDRQLGNMLLCRICFVILCDDHFKYTSSNHEYLKFNSTRRYHHYSVFKLLVIALQTWVFYAQRLGEGWKNYNNLTTSVGFREVEADGTFCIFVTAFTAFELWVTLSVGDPGQGKSGEALGTSKNRSPNFGLLIDADHPWLGSVCIACNPCPRSQITSHSIVIDLVMWPQDFPSFKVLIRNSENDTVIVKTKKTESTNKSWWPSSWQWRWPVVVVVHRAGADRRANEDKQNVKHAKSKDLETAKHIREADNKLSDLVLLDMKLLANPSHIRRPPSLHFDLADFLDRSEGKLEQELLAVFVHVLFDSLWQWMCPWFLVHDVFSCIYAKT